MRFLRDQFVMQCDSCKVTVEIPRHLMHNPISLSDFGYRVDKTHMCRDRRPGINTLKWTPLEAAKKFFSQI